jgi:pilus assembly protein CpaE
MSLLLLGPIGVVGARDRDLEAMLTAAGLRSSPLPASELASLAHQAGRPPAILVIDLRDAGQCPAVLPQLKKQHPQTAVVLVASAPEPTLMLEAMRAGVSECLFEPLDHAALIAAVRRVSEQHETPVIGQVFGVMGAKGGVGATTVAVNLATELVKVAPGQTLLIDLHLWHGDAATALGAEPRFTVLDALQNARRLDEAMFRGLVTPTKAGVDVLASADSWPTQSTPLDGMRDLLDCAARLYRYVVLDLPRTGAGSADPLEGLTRLVVVANQELSTIRHASSLVVSLQRRYGHERVSVVVSRFDPQSEIRRQDIEQVIKLPIRHTVPSDYRLAVRAQNMGRPLTLDNHNRLASAFRELTRDLAGLTAAPEAASTSTGLFGRLSGRRSQPR